MKCSKKKADSIQKRRRGGVGVENKRRGDTSKCHGQFGRGQMTGERGWRTGNIRDKMRELTRWKESNNAAHPPSSWTNGEMSDGVDGVSLQTPAACTTGAQADEEDERKGQKKWNVLFHHCNILTCCHESITIIKYQALREMLMERTGPQQESEK